MLAEKKRCLPKIAFDGIPQRKIKQAELVNPVPSCAPPGSALAPAKMLALMVLSSVATLLFVYIFMPALWLSIVATDESLDAHESGLAFVASRMYPARIPTRTLLSHSSTPGNPFRETGPPANMAKLILLRHKVSLHILAFALSRTDTSTTCRSRQVTGNGAALLIRGRPHEHTLHLHFERQKRPGCVSENPSQESNTIDARPTLLSQSLP